MSELYQKAFISKDDRVHLPYLYMEVFSSRSWLDSHVQIQSSKPSDVHAKTFHIIISIEMLKLAAGEAGQT